MSCSHECDPYGDTDNASEDLVWEGGRSVGHGGPPNVEGPNFITGFLDLEPVSLTKGYVKRHFVFPLRDLERNFAGNYSWSTTVYICYCFQISPPSPPLTFP